MNRNNHVVDRLLSVRRIDLKLTFDVQAGVMSPPNDTDHRPCCMDHPEGYLIIVFFNTGDNLDAT